jgi:hypothetical protein
MHLDKLKGALAFPQRCLQIHDLTADDGHLALERVAVEVLVHLKNFVMTYSLTTAQLRVSACFQLQPKVNYRTGERTVVSKLSQN